MSLLYIEFLENGMNYSGLTWAKATKLRLFISWHPKLSTAITLYPF
jgi:hypothetical protein